MSQAIRVQWAELRRDDLPCYIPPDVKRQSTVAYIGQMFGKEIVTLQSGQSTYIYYDEQEFLAVERKFKPAGLKKRATCLVRDRLSTHGLTPSIRRSTLRQEHSDSRRKLTIEVYSNEAQLQSMWDKIRATLVLQGGSVVFVGHKMEGVPCHV